MDIARHGTALSFFLLASALLACKGIGDLIGGAPSATSAPSAVPSVTAPAAPTEITFVKSVPKAGAKAKVETSGNVKFTLEGKVFRSTEVGSVGVEVQNSDEFRVTKAALDVKELFSTEQLGTGAEKKTVSPLSGSRFIVTRADDGKLSALDASGNKVKGVQMTQIEKHYKTVFERDKSREFLPNRPVKIGEKLVPSADTVLALLGQKDDGSTSVDGVEFILRSASAGKATFDVSLTFTQKAGGGMRLRAKLAGSIDVRPEDSTILNITLRGPLTILDTQGNDKGNGELSFTGSETPA
jgi:hypothetical protein